MDAPASPNKQKNYRLDFWFRKALLTPHQASQKLLGDLIPAIYEAKDAGGIFQRVTQAISLFYGRHNTTTSAGDGIELSVDEMEEKLFPQNNVKGDEKERVRIPNCALSDASKCSRWTLVRNFENCPVGSFPTTECGPFIGILDSYSAKFMKVDRRDKGDDDKNQEHYRVINSNGKKRPYEDDGNQTPGDNAELNEQPFKVRLLT
mmetsp:Transcript_29874/g.36848  ORF Transcript_29874/g.36848 Transcript_29874/m.36848 type:complete len:205 (+) Transcript_29874:397-1011(+)